MACSSQPACDILPPMRRLLTLILFYSFFLPLPGTLSFQGTLHAATEESGDALQELAKRVRTFRLSNGLRVIMYKRGTAPVFAGVVTVRVGGSDETIGETGISHMLEHMAFKGTPVIGTRDYKREKPLLEELEELAAAERKHGKLTEEQAARREQIDSQLKDLWVLGDFSNQYDKRGASGMNATTDKETTKYFVNFPRNAFEFWCWMESERILNPVMRQFYTERDVVMEERRMRFEDDPQGKLYEMMLAAVYSQHPYRNPVIGYDFDLSRLTATMVAGFHKLYYTPDNIVVAVVGDVDPDRDIAVLEKYFGRIPPGTRPPLPDITEPQQSGERRITLKTRASPQFYVSYRKPNYPHPDDAAISVMAEILVGSKISPLYTELVKRKKIASEIGYYEGPGDAYPNLMIFYASTTNPYRNQDVLDAFDAVIGRFKSGGITAEDLAIAKRSVAMQYLAHLKSNMSLAKDFSESEAIYNNWKASLDWYDDLVNVSVADVNRVAEKYLIEDARTIAVIENNASQERR